MRRIVLVFATIALAAGMTAAPAWSAEGGTERPMQTRFSFTVDVTTGVGSGSAIATHWGLSGLSFQFTSPTTSFLVVTTASGDQVFQATASTSATTGVNTILGGTGRFEGATGELHTTFEITPTSDPNVVAVTGSSEGWISY